MKHLLLRMSGRLGLVTVLRAPDDGICDLKGDRGLRTSHPEPLRGCGLVGRADKVLGTESLVGGAIEELCLSEVGGSTRCWEWSKVRLGSQLTETP